jgi:hypothetical protein
MRLALAVLAVALLAGCSTPAPTDPADRTIEQRMRAIADQAWDDLLSQHPDAERPEYRVERMITMDEWGAVIAACMNDLGFTSVKDSGDGGILSGDMHTSQAEAYDIGMYDCQARYPLDPKYSEPLTDDQLSLIYDYNVDELTPCAEALGYEIGPAPSRQQFIETYDTEPWLPLGDIIQSIAATGDGGDIQKLLEACPDVPPNLYG